MDRRSVEGDVRIRVLYINIPGEPPSIGCPQRTNIYINANEINSRTSYETNIFLLNMV